MTTSGILGAANEPIIPTPVPVYLGGYLADIREDTYPDGKPCVVATHPDLPGCFGYGDDHSEACQMLETARSLYVASLKEHGEEVPASILCAVTGSAHWQMASDPIWSKTTVRPTVGAAPVIQTA